MQKIGIVSCFSKGSMADKKRRDKSNKKKQPKLLSFMNESVHP
jgi:hypothetical protein